VIKVKEGRCPCGFEYKVFIDSNTVIKSGECPNCKKKIKVEEKT